MSPDPTPGPSPDTKPGNPTASFEPRRAWLAAGILLLVLAAAQPFLAARVQPAWMTGLLATMAAELVSGRETAYILAFAQGVPPAWVGLASALQNLGLAFLIAPVALRAWNQVERKGAAGRFLAALRTRVEGQRPRAANAAALLAFMLVPFLPNGAVVAAILGGLANLRPATLALVLVAGVAVPSFAWAMAHALLRATLDGVHPAIAAIPTFVAVLAAVAGMMAAWRSMRSPPVGSDPHRRGPGP